MAVPEAVQRHEQAEDTCSASWQFDAQVGSAEAVEVAKDEQNELADLDSLIICRRQLLWLH